MRLLAAELARQTRSLIVIPVGVQTGPRYTERTYLRFQKHYLSAFK